MSDLDTDHMDDDLLPEIDSKGEETWLLSRDEPIGRQRRSATPPPRVRSLSNSSTTSTMRRWKEAVTPAEWDREREMLTRQADEARVGRIEALRRERSTKTSLSLEQRVHNQDNNALQSRVQALQGKVMNLQKMINVKDRTLDDAKLRSKTAESELLQLRLEYYDWKDTVEVAKIDNHDNKELLAALQCELSKGGKHRWPSLEGSPGAARTPQLPSRGSEVSSSKQATEPFILSDSDITTFKHKCLNTPEVFPGDDTTDPSPVGSLLERRRSQSESAHQKPLVDTATSPLSEPPAGNWQTVTEGSGTQPPSPDRDRNESKYSLQSERKLTIPQDSIDDGHHLGGDIQHTASVSGSDVRRSLNLDTETSDARRSLSTGPQFLTSNVDESSPSDVRGSKNHQTDRAPSPHSSSGPRQRLHDTSNNSGGKGERNYHNIGSHDHGHDSSIVKSSRPKQTTSPTRSQRNTSSQHLSVHYSGGGGGHLRRSQNTSSTASRTSNVAQQKYALRQERARSRSSDRERDQDLERHHHQHQYQHQQHHLVERRREVPNLSSVYPGQIYSDLRRTDLVPASRPFDSFGKRTDTSPPPPDRATELDNHINGRSINSLGWDEDASPMRYSTGVQKHRSREKKMQRQQQQQQQQQQRRQRQSQHPTPTSIVKSIYNSDQNCPVEEDVVAAAPPPPKVPTKPTWPVLVSIKKNNTSYLTVSSRPPPELAQGRYADATELVLDYQQQAAFYHSNSVRRRESSSSANGIRSALTTPQHTPRMSTTVDPSYLGTPMPLPHTDAGKFTPQ